MPMVCIPMRSMALTSCWVIFLERGSNRPVLVFDAERRLFLDGDMSTTKGAVDEFREQFPLFVNNWSFWIRHYELAQYEVRYYWTLDKMANHLGAIWCIHCSWGQVILISADGWQYGGWKFSKRGSRVWRISPSSFKERWDWHLSSLSTSRPWWESKSDNIPGVTSRDLRKIA